ncbi:MAG: phosphohistidine phosphatase SixA [Candidatus Hydrogenedentes bacterium]|nr:phosphohistidine phosphatase SixA [Candidatus Hydrogenedentota bacterium]
MKLYLIQHAEAFGEEIDPERALTPAGRRATEVMGKWVARLAPDVPVVWHSGKLRALQTAEGLMPHLAPTGCVEEHAGLKPKDDVALIVEEIHRRAADVAIVGHLPHLSRLASYLLTGNEEPSIVAFQMAGIACLEQRGANPWTLSWMVTPDLVGSVRPIPRMRHDG